MKIINTLKTRIREIFVLICLMFTVISVLPAFAIEIENVQPAKKVQTNLNYEDIWKKARDHSYDLQIADFNVLISKQEIRNARSEYFPKFNLGISTEYTHNLRDNGLQTVSVVGDTYINPYTRYQTVLGITMAYNLFDFGTRRNNLDMSKEDVEAKKLIEEKTLQELNLTIINTFSKIVLIQKQLDLYKEILSIETKSLELKQRLYDAKEISKVELDEQKVKVLTVQNKINDLNSIIKESLAWLTFYTGEEYNSENLKITEIKKTSTNNLTYSDYTQSIVWKIHEKELKKKELELKMAKKAYLPKANIYGRYYLYGSDPNNYGKSYGDIRPSSYTIGASINMPLFDGFKTGANIQKVSLEYKQLLVERDKAIAEFTTKLATMRSNLISLETQMNVNNQIISDLENKNKAIKKLVSKQIVSPIELNNAKVELIEQQIEYEKNRISSIAIMKGIEILTLTPDIKIEEKKHGRK